MAERLLNAANAAVLEAEGAGRPAMSPGQAQEAAMRKEKAPMKAADAIQRILLAHKDKDYFRCGRGWGWMDGVCRACGVWG